MEDIQKTPITPKLLDLCYDAAFSDLVPMEIQLRSLLKPFINLEGWWIVLPGTPTLGSTAIPQLNLTAWHPSIRSMIRERLVQMGGVPLESPVEIKLDSEGNLSVRLAKKLDNSLHALTVEPATDDDVPA